MIFNLIIAMFILESILFFKLMRLALEKKASLAMMTTIMRFINFVDLIALESNMIFIFRESLESLLEKSKIFLSPWSPWLTEGLRNCFRLPKFELSKKTNWCICIRNQPISNLVLIIPLQVMWMLYWINILILTFQ